MAFSSVKEIFDRIPEVFNEAAAQGMDAVFQFNITGDGGGNWHLTVRDGTFQIQEGNHENPSVTLTMSSDRWLSIVNRESNAMQAFMMGRLKASGDLVLAQRLPSLFSL